MNDKEKIKKLTEALVFYADPGNYFAITFFSDPPSGAFIDDFSKVSDSPYYDREMPGTFARETLKKIYEIK